MLADFVDDSRLVLAEGEVKELKIWLSNAGTSNIRELWVVAGADDDVWVDIDGSTRSHCSEYLTPVLFLDTNILPLFLATTLTMESFQSRNSLSPQTPYRIDLTTVHGSPLLEPQSSLEFSLFLHADIASPQDLRLLFISREVRQYFLACCISHAVDS